MVRNVILKTLQYALDKWNLDLTPVFVSYLPNVAHLSNKHRAQMQIQVTEEVI